jgi:hypothetical protein
MRRLVSACFITASVMAVPLTRAAAQSIRGVELGKTTMGEVQRNHTMEPDETGLTEDGRDTYLKYGNVGYYFSVEDSVADFVRIYPTGKMARADVHRRLGRPRRSSIGADLSATDFFGDTLVVVYTAANAVSFLEYEARENLRRRRLHAKSAAYDTARARPSPIAGADSDIVASAPRIDWSALVGAELTLRTDSSYATLAYHLAREGAVRTYSRGWIDHDTAGLQTATTSQVTYGEFVTYREVRGQPQHFTILRRSYTSTDTIARFLEYEGGLLSVSQGDTPVFYGPTRGALPWSLYDAEVASLPLDRDSVSFWVIDDQFEPPVFERVIVRRQALDTMMLPLVGSTGSCLVSTRGHLTRVAVRWLRVQRTGSSDLVYPVLANAPHLRADQLTCLHVPTAARARR